MDYYEDDICRANPDIDMDVDYERDYDLEAKDVCETS